MAAVLKPIPIIALNDDSNKDFVWKGWFEHVRFIVNNNVLSTSWSNISSTPTTFSGYGISTTSANLLAAISDETGTGALVFANTPTLVTPILGTPTSGTLTNCTLPVGGITGLAAGVATFLATSSSVNLKAAVTDETGSGALVFADTPTLVTPVLGAATGTSVVLTGDVTTGSVAQFHKTSVNLTNGAGVGAGTLLTAPAAGNPTKWIGIDDNGTIRYIPAW